MEKAITLNHLYGHVVHGNCREGRLEQMSLNLITTLFQYGFQNNIQEKRQLNIRRRENRNGKKSNEQLPIITEKTNLYMISLGTEF